MSSDNLTVGTLKALLTENYARVVDLFKAWDEDGSGCISKKEFRRALVALELSASFPDMNALFDAIDRDGSGHIEYKELQRALTTRPSASSTVSVGTGKIRRQRTVGEGIGSGLGSGELAVAREALEVARVQLVERSEMGRRARSLRDARLVSAARGL